MCDDHRRSGQGLPPVDLTRRRLLQVTGARRALRDIPEATDPAASADARLITSSAAEPSEYGLALPAVTVPVGLKAGRSFASPSAVVSARGVSSRSKVHVSTCFFAPSHVTRSTSIGRT